MNEILDPAESLPLREYTEKAYLDYSMYVILDRALPNIGDGLKPVQRRIVYAMSELGLKESSKHKKSARTVGDVLGKYHPHGDGACYEAMVLMAQPFSYRYPLVDGQGNWGSMDDPKSFAAMRYTEARLRPYAQLLLSELGQATVDWVPNFDGTLKEPKVLPSRVPNVLLNGGTGIAVGMSTDIPPHNLVEVLNACITLLNSKSAGLDDICEHIQGPDFPTDAEIITPVHEIRAMYAKGKGSIKMRAVFEQEGSDLVITALPYQASGAKILEQIASQMQAKKLPMVSDLRDESDHENPVRLVVTPKSNRVDTTVLMNHLFATTDLEKNYRVNLNVIGLDGRPKVMGLVEILREWLDFRRQTVIRRLEHRLDQVTKRLHILEGYMAAFLNIDEVIHIIRTEDNPKMALMESFELSEKQADAILDLKLRQIAKLEEIKIRAEQEELEAERESLEKTLGSKARLKTLMVKELKAIIKDYGDYRRSPLVERKESKALSEAELVTSEPVTVVLSDKGWARVAKGHEVDASKLNYRSGDGYLCSVRGKSNELVVFLDSSGRSYAVQAFTLPSARGLGEPLSGRLNPPSGAQFIGALMGAGEQSMLVASDAGYGFITTIGDMITKNKSGKGVLTLPKGAKVLPPIELDPAAGELKVAALSNEGRLLIFELDDLPSMARGKGNKLMNIPPARVVAREEFVLAVEVLAEDSVIKIKCGKRTLTLSPKDWSHYIGERGRRGNKLPRGYQKVSSMSVEGEE